MSYLGKGHLLKAIDGENNDLIMSTLLSGTIFRNAVVEQKLR